MGRTVQLAVGLAGVLLGAWPAAAADLAAFVGHYAYSGSRMEQQALSDEVDRAIGQLNFLLQPLARMAVDKRKLTPQAITIRWDGRRIGIQTPPAGFSETPADGSPVTVSSQGRTITLRRFLDHGVLMAVNQANDGVSTTAMRLTADRQRLTVHTVLETRYVPTPISVTLTYLRQR